MKKCVILDADGVNPGDLSWDAIAGVTDLTVHNIYPSTPREEVLSRIGDAELVLLNKIPIDAALLAEKPNLRYIGVLATGYNAVSYTHLDVYKRQGQGCHGACPKGAPPPAL